MFPKISSKRRWTKHAASIKAQKIIHDLNYKLNLFTVNDQSLLCVDLGKSKISS